MTLVDMIEYHPIFSSQNLFVTGTDTDVGKTYVTNQIIRGFQEREIGVFGIKPVLTGIDPNIGTNPQSDSELIKATCNSIIPKYYTPRLFQALGGPIESFKAPLSPISAAALEGKSFDWAKVENELKSIIQECYKERLVTVVEGIGGPLVPLAKRYYVADAIKSLGMNAILVTRSTLGTISQTLTSLEALQRRGIIVSAVIVSRASITEELRADELSSLRELTQEMGKEMPFYLIQHQGIDFIPVSWLLKRS